MSYGVFTMGLENEREEVLIEFEDWIEVINAVELREKMIKSLIKENKELHEQNKKLKTVMALGVRNLKVRK